MLTYIVWAGLPKINHWFIGISMPNGFSFFYHLIKELLSNLVGSVFFYLVFETWNEKTKINNELTYIIYSYKQIKKDILEQMIMAEYGGLRPRDTEDIVDKLYLSPKVAQEYFSQERFKAMWENLDDSPMRTIIRKMRFFLEQLDNLSHKFVENGDFSLRHIFNEVREMEDRIEEGGIPFAWFSDLEYKSKHPLYKLFCQKIGAGGQDPYIQILTLVLEKYKS